jgi:hypothetical protein
MKITRKKGIDKIKIEHNKTLFWLIIVLIVFFIGFIIYSMSQFDYDKKEKAEIGNECVVDSDCVPETCCHASSCVPANEAPDCSNLMCTMECAPGTMDCGQGSCGCVNGKCGVRVKG